VVDTPDEADVAIFNSCAVTHEAVVDLRKSVRRASRQRESLRSIVMGCAAAVDHGELQSLPSVEQVIPGADYPAIASALGLSVAPSVLLRGAQSGTRALLRIQDGCDEHCTFCATTMARGENRSRPMTELVAEAQRLAESHREIVLTWIHIGTYGRDIGSSLGVLVERLIDEVPDVRFRLSSIEATEVDVRLEALWSDPMRLAPHLHAPLQSGADRILRRMGRHWYTGEEYSRAIERITTGQSVFGLGADVIAGFPGETDAEHAQTLAMIESLPFTYLHVFPFSLRPGTAAERLPGHLDSATIARRASDLRQAAARKESAYAASRVGTETDLVVVRAATREALTEDYLTVTIDGAALPRGTRVRAELSQLDGRLVARPLLQASLT
jgi:threonylcarbamoyladenosine tRNA methylthiotransferase MtaB